MQQFMLFTDYLVQWALFSWPKFLLWCRLDLAVEAVHYWGEVYWTLNQNPL